MGKLFHFALADFRERSRQYGFLILLVLLFYLGYVVYSGDFILLLDDYRGVYNAAWVGAMMALVVTTTLSLFGFYLLRNSIQRDIQTGVGQIIASTPNSKLTYLAGKWLSHIFLVMVMLAVMVGCAFLLMVFQSEVPGVEVWDLVAPFIIVALPAMVFVSALAILFEAVPWLRGGWGNVIYFLLWLISLPVMLESFERWGWHNDLIGIHLFMPSMQSAALQAFPDYTGDYVLTISANLVKDTFFWPGIHWTGQIILDRLVWVGLGFAVILLTSLVFNRFDPHHVSAERKKTARRQKSTSIDYAQPLVGKPELPSIQQRESGFAFGRVWLGEFRLMVKGLPWWVYVTAGGLAIACATSPLVTTRQILLPLVWVLPVFVWSKLGCREKMHQTQQLVFSAQHLLRNQWLAAYIAAVSLTALLGSGALLNLALHGSGEMITGWLVAVFFIPALAMACGVISGTSHTFEIVFALWWYLGPIQRVAQLNFVDLTGYLLPYTMLTLFFVGVAWLGRSLQIRNAV